MDSSSPLVSIMIVTWNRRRQVLRAIESALRQTYPHIEIVVVDNASTDGSADMIAGQFPDVRLIRSHKNLGCPTGRNLGMINCRGEYVYCLDDDGWLQNDAVEIAVARMESNPTIAVVLSTIHEMDDGGVVQKRPQGLSEPAFISFFSGGCSLLRLKSVEQAGLYPDDFFRQGEEKDLALRLLEAGYYLFYEPGSVMCHAPQHQAATASRHFYYSLRNTTKTALRFYPLRYAAGQVFLNAWHACRYALKHGALYLPLVLFGDFIHDLARSRGGASLFLQKP